MQYRSLVQLKANHKRRAFTLLEMSIVILIIGIMVASILPAITQQTAIEKAKELTQKMDAIEDALEAFRIKNGRLPCPAQPDLARNSDDFGVVAAAPPDVCAGGTLSALQAGADGATYGILPVRTLGLDDDAAFDPWGRAFTYMVSDDIIASGAYTTFPIDDITVGNITVQVRDQIGATLSNQATKAIAAVVSHGPNGHGAYLPSGARYSSDSNNADEHENCNCDSDAAADNENATFVQALQSSSASGAGFDDTVRYYNRGSFTAVGDFIPEL